MTKKPLPRLASALLVGALAVVPVAASVAMAPSAAAIYLPDGTESDLDLDALAELGIAPASADLMGIEPVSADLEESTTGIEFRDEDGNLVTPADIDPDGVDRHPLARDHQGIEPIAEGDYQEIMPISGDFQEIEPISGELGIEPISADVNGGLSAGAIVAIVAGGVVVVGAGAGLGLRARRARA